MNLAISPSIIVGVSKLINYFLQKLNSVCYGLFSPFGVACTMLNFHSIILNRQHLSILPLDRLEKSL